MFIYIKLYIEYSQEVCFMFSTFEKFVLCLERGSCIPLTYWKNHNIVRPPKVCSRHIFRVINSPHHDNALTDLDEDRPVQVEHERMEIIIGRYHMPIYSEHPDLVISAVMFPNTNSLLSYRSNDF